MASRNPSRPNLLFILSDDQGAWAMGCAGNEEIRTPNLDRLAREGIRFDNFFCASPVCSPARASILTGLIPSQHGVHDFISMPHDRQGQPNRNSPANGIPFLEGNTCYPELLADIGYRTCLSGKWHLGDAREAQCGFEDWYPMPFGQCSYRDVPIVKDGGHTCVNNTYATDLFTDNALKFLEEQVEEEAPFCLNVSYTAPHKPWGREHHPEELWDDYYNNCPFKSTPGPEETLASGFQRYSFLSPSDAEARKKVNPSELRRQDLAGYFASIEAMDSNIGRLVSWLDEQNLRSNTLIVFMGDNGMNTGHHGIWGKGNGTWPQNLFDTSVKIPCLISRPGHVPEHKISSTLLSQYDWLSTIVDYAGDASLSPSGLPGRSFAPILRGHKFEECDRIFVFDEYGPVRMIRSKQWKLIWRYPAGAHELYDVSNDPDEKVNLFDEPGFANLIAELRRELDDWYAAYIDPNIDGSKLPITGYGQRDHASVKKAFNHRFQMKDRQNENV